MLNGFPLRIEERFPQGHRDFYLVQQKTPLGSLYVDG